MPEDKNAILHAESVDNIIGLAYNKIELTDAEKKEIYNSVVNAGVKVLPSLYQDYEYKNENLYNTRGKIDLLTAISTELGLDKLSDTDVNDVAKKRAISEFVIESIGLTDGYRDAYDGGIITTSFNSLIIDKDALSKFENDVRGVIESEGGGADLVYFDRLSIDKILLSNVSGKQNQNKLTNQYGTAVNLKSSEDLGKYYNIDYRKEDIYNLLHSSSDGVFSQETLKALKDDPILGKYIEHRTEVRGKNVTTDFYHLNLPDEIAKNLPTTFEEHYSSTNLGQNGHVSLNPVSVSVIDKGDNLENHKNQIETQKNNGINNRITKDLQTQLYTDYIVDGTEGYDKPNTTDKEVIAAEKLKVFNQLTKTEEETEVNLEKEQEVVKATTRELLPFLDKGIYVSDNYEPDGHEDGYTGKAKKVVIPGIEFKADDPTTFKWQHEKVVIDNDGNKKYIFEDAGNYVNESDGKYGFDESIYNKLDVAPPPASTKQEVDTEKDKKMGIELGNVITALKAGAGLIGLGKAMKDLPIGENQELSDSFKAYMQKTKELADSGLTAQEKASIKNDLSNAYNLGAKNVLRASAGSRGTFLSNMGMLNANRVNSLIKMGEIDAKMQRENMANYGNMLTFQEKFKADQGAVGREMAYKESLRKSNLYGGIGSSLIGSAISDLTAAEQMKKMTPYMNQWAKNMGLTTTATNTESDAQDDAKSSITI